MSFSFLLSFEKNAKAAQAYDKIAYDLGEALTLLNKEAAIRSNSLSGQLYAAADNSILLDVPNSFIRGSFDALSETGITLPGKDGKFHGHIVVMTPEEVRSLKGVSKITERGHRFNYNIGALHEAPVTNSLHHGKVWFFSISSQELSKLRKSYGLSPTPGKHGFHIVVALRKIGVLGNNNISKQALAAKRIADLLPGGQADGMPDAEFNKKKLRHAQKHEMEHTTDPAIAKEVAKDHMLEDENYYKKIEKIEKLSALLKLSTVRTVMGHESNAEVTTPAAEDMAFLSDKPSNPKPKAPVKKDRMPNSKVRKAVIQATEDTFGVDPSVKEGSWTKVLHKFLELGLN
jgi:hypothetical protein